MFKAERIQKIKEIIFDRKQVNVATLSKLLNVTDVTIRSDLEALEKTGFITRMHGGAVLNEESAKEDNINDLLAGRSIEFDRNKEEIGKVSAKLIQEKEWVFIGPGNTCYYIAKSLLNRNNINIFTNNLYVINTLYANPAINVITAGGMLNHERFSTYGDIFDQMIEGMYFSKAFFTVGGADIKAGYTSPDDKETSLIRSVAERTKELIFALDYTKFDQISFMQIGDLSFANTVISNDKMPQAYKEYYTDHSIKVYTSYDIKSLSI